MALMTEQAIQLLVLRYSISAREAKKCFESDIDMLRLAARDCWGKRIPGAKTYFEDGKDYSMYLDNLEDWR